MPKNNETESTSLFESRQELPIGARMPPPFEMFCIASFLRRTNTGGWLYAIAIVPDAIAAAAAVAEESAQ